jgi:hypothetical protein
MKVKVCGALLVLLALASLICNLPVKLTRLVEIALTGIDPVSAELDHHTLPNRYLEPSRQVINSGAFAACRGADFFIAKGEGFASLSGNFDSGGRRCETLTARA